MDPQVDVDIVVTGFLAEQAAGSQSGAIKEEVYEGIRFLFEPRGDKSARWVDYTDVSHLSQFQGKLSLEISLADESL